ncbi:unnamed protein product [Cochlearia groenlandica]
MILPSLKHDEEKLIKQLDEEELIQRDITQSRAKDLPRGVQAMLVDEEPRIMRRSSIKDHLQCLHSCQERRPSYEPLSD